MELLYIWVREYKNIRQQGFNLSSKVTFDTEILASDPKNKDTLCVSLVAMENQDIINDFFPSNIFDVKAIIGENGAGKSNFIFSLLNIFLDKRNKLNGFLVTTDNIIIRDKITFSNKKVIVFGKSLKYLNPEDIYNFNNNQFKKSFTEDKIHGYYGQNLMETYFKENCIIYYSPFINTDNIHNIDGIENDYSRWENTNPNFVNISTESMIVSDYQSLNSNTEKYLITGESELLAFKYEESIRMLNFINEANDFNLKIKFKIEFIQVEFTAFGDKFWKSVDTLISQNKSTASKIIEKELQFEKELGDGNEDVFFKELEKSLTYCFLSYELKYYFNYSKEQDIPLSRLIDNLTENYTSGLNDFKSLYNYIIKTEIYSKNASVVIEQLEYIRKYFLEKFKNEEIICNGMYGFGIKENNISDIVKDFLKSPLRSIKLDDDRMIILNIFGFNFQGLSSGEKSVLSLFSRIKYFKDSYIIPSKSILFIIDEGEMGFHPQWQKKYLTIILNFFEKFFSNNRVQLILTTHSPFIVSDLLKENIVFLKKNKKGMTEISDITNCNLTFGANIHDLLANNFFLQDGFIGDFAKKKIEFTLNWLKTKATEINKSKQQNSNFMSDGKIKELNFTSIKEELKYHKMIINSIGEPLVRHKLNQMFIEYADDNEKTFLNQEVEKARIRYEELKRKQQNDQHLQ